MKEIAVFANLIEYSSYIAACLEVYFAGQAEFHAYTTTELESMSEIREEFVVLSAYSIYQKVKEKLRDQSRLLVVERTMRKSSIEMIRKLPPGTRALLVNMDYATCIEVINMIYASGVKEIDLVPYYPGCGFDAAKDGDIRLAITVGETNLVPSFVSEVMDFGERAIDIQSIYRIAEAIGAPDPLRTSEAQAAAGELMNFGKNTTELLEEKKRLLGRLSSILRIIQKGVVITDNFGKIYMMNELAEEMLGVRGSETEGFHIAEVLPELRFTPGGTAGEAQEDLIRLGGRDVMVTLTSVQEDEEPGSAGDGRILMLEYFGRAEARQHQFRRKLSAGGHVARYTLDQIQGISPEIHVCKEIAERLAGTDSSICITGESGTGKELFAQSIHNASARRKYSFVAINCSALPENLLESELYGYEEGAFSGAKKGGKIGLFELAHRGTLFLDEVGELPLSMQAKLLRAIEEKQILRVGGRDLIDVDVRIISATNKDLKAMIREGTFREDLYYRLCVLPLQVPPIRERTGDVAYLLEALARELGVKLRLSPESRDLLVSYEWPGNVREMRNAIEYLSSLGREEIRPADLAAIGMVKEGHHRERACTPPSGRALPSEQDIERFVLREVYAAQQNCRCIGRRQLAELARIQEQAISEQEIRRCLTELKRKGLLSSGRGRQGSRITREGLDYLQNGRNG